MLCLGDDVGEIRIEQQIVQRWVPRISLGDAVEEARPNNAAASPNGRDIAEI